MTCRRYVHGIRGIEGEFAGAGVHQPQEGPHLGS